MEEIKNVPEIRFDGFSDDWNIDTFENLTSINQGLQISIANRYLKRIPNSHFYITNEFLKEGAKSEYYILNPPESVLCTKDDVLMTRTGNTGEVVTDVNGAFHNNFFKIDFDRKVIDKDYLVHLLKNDSTKALILNLAGVSTIPDLNHNDFYQIAMPFPDIDEQIKISSTLNNLDDSIKNHNTQLKKLTNLKKAMLIKMFPQDGANIPEIRFKGFYGEWGNVSFQKIFDSTISTNTLSRAMLSSDKYVIKNIHYGDILIKYDSIVNATTDDISYIIDGELIDYKNQLLLDGDVIFADAAEDFMVGKAIEIQNSKEVNIVAGLHTIACRPKVEIQPNYLGYYLNSESYRNQLMSLFQGSKVLSISKNNLNITMVQLPQSEVEQRKIGVYFKNLDNLISNHKEQLKKLNQIKKACLTKLFVSQD